MHPVGATLPGRRNNPADPASGIRPLAVYGPIHYQDLPELFMDFVCSLTGKSPSTTGAGSEGALTKGPFNSLVPTTDLNNALLSFILTGYGGFTTRGRATSAASIGWSTTSPSSCPSSGPGWAPTSATPNSSSSNGYLEKIEDFEYEGELVPASRLGWRITPLFATTFIGRIFDTPILRLRRRHAEARAPVHAGLRRRRRATSPRPRPKSAAAYFEDGSVEAAIPPLKAILHVMAKGHYEGKGIHDPELRALFDRESVAGLGLVQASGSRPTATGSPLTSPARWSALGCYLAESAEAGSVAARRARSELARTEERMAALSQPGYLDMITGSIGLDPLFRGRA